MSNHFFIFAHPDDEFACSGIISRLVKQGAGVHCIYLTDGGHGGQSTAKRRAESEAALSRLGLNVTHIHQLGMDHGLPDGLLHTKMPKAYDVLLATIESIISPAGGITIHLPAWEGGHQDHDASHAIGIAAARRYRAALRQFPLYCGKGLPGPLFSVKRHLAENGKIVDGVRLGPKERISAITLCFEHRSQWKSWLGLLPFFGAKILLRGRFDEQGVSSHRIEERPHAGPLLYERRGGPTYEDVATAVSALLSFQSNGSGNLGEQ